MEASDDSSMNSADGKAAEEVHDEPQSSHDESVHPTTSPEHNPEDEKQDAPSLDPEAEVDGDNLDDEDGLEKKSKNACGFTGRGVTLQMLLEDKILEPKEGSMSLEYMGQKFNGDLLPDGKIFSAEVQEVFSSPSAWALRCKKIVNPEQKYGCGWSSIKYCGKPLDAYKNSWLRKRRLEHEGGDDASTRDECGNTSSTHEPLENNNPAEVETEPSCRMEIAEDWELVKHDNVANRTPLERDPSLLVETITFASLGKLQPFLVSISATALIVIEVHCSLTRSEVVGYLGGTWDVGSNTLIVKQAFPCLNQLGDDKCGRRVEVEIAQKMESAGLLLVGWYHSHASAPPTPTVQDIDAQLDYQLKLKGTGEQGYRPCIGLISSPFYKGTVADSTGHVAAYWVSPPPENKPHELGRPMAMSLNVTHDVNVKEAAPTIKSCITFFETAPDRLDLEQRWDAERTVLDQIKTSVKEIAPEEDTSIVNDLFNGFASAKRVEQVDSSV